MKKIICFMLCILLCFAFVGCANTNGNYSRLELTQNVQLGEFSFMLTENSVYLGEQQVNPGNVTAYTYSVIDEDKNVICAIVIAQGELSELGVTKEEIDSETMAYEEDIIERITGTDFENTKKTTIAGVEGYYWYNEEDEANMYYFVTDNYTYVIGIGVTEDEAAQDLINRIISSMTIIPTASAQTNNGEVPITTTDTQTSENTVESGVTRGAQNALKTAQNYLRTMPFSYSGLIDQLEYEGYTTEEATYGVDNCGADWDEQAVLQAKSYLKTMSFSRSGLIDQLEYEGFTAEQAEYGVNAVGL